MVPLRPQDRLDKALGGFLQSDALARIGSLQKIDATDAERVAREDFKGAVSAQFVTNAAKAAHRAIARTFRSHIWLPLALAAVVPTFAFLLSIFLGTPRSYRLPIAIVSGIVAAVFLELFARWRMRSRFDSTLRERVSAVLQASRTAWWWRAGLVVSVVFVFVAVFAIMVAADVKLR